MYSVRKKKCSQYKCFLHSFHLPFPFSHAEEMLVTALAAFGGLCHCDTVESKAASDCGYIQQKILF